MPCTWSVAIVSPHYATLSYLEPDYLPAGTWHTGQRVVVPMGNSLRVGVLLGRDSTPSTGAGGSVPQADQFDALQSLATHEEPPEKNDITLKPLLWPIDHVPLLSPDYLHMAEHLARRQLSLPGRILGTLLPSGLRTTRFKYVVKDAGKTRMLSPKDIKELPPQYVEHLAACWQNGDMAVKEQARNVIEFCTVRKDPPWPVRPSAKRQIQLLEYVWERGRVSKGELRKELGDSSSSVLKSLHEKGLIGIAPAQESETQETDACTSFGRAFDLLDDQELALDNLRKALASDAGETRLLFGVTGSGKTVLYLELAKACVEQGKSAYLLAPEIALACNLLKAAQNFFPAPAQGGPQICFYHGYQSPAQRERTFKHASAAKGPVLVIGTRSALFLPAPAPGLVILDEEHDASFKQDERMNYQAKEIAWFMVNQCRGLLLLGSATPDVKTYYATEQGAATSVVLKNRVSGKPMPEIELVDIRNVSATDHLLADKTIDLLKETVKRGDQAIIMLNRRGYAPLMYCLDCGKVARCPNCEIGLTYHKQRERLICHYCGQSLPFPLICGGCGGAHYLPMGEGTEKLEETLADEIFKETNILRLDRDSTRRPGRMEEILNAFANQEAQILVGTQMLSKGHHFPNVTRVVVADGDMGLNLPDYRATERTFQLLVQVAGRAGRGDKPGAVCIQTRDPANACWGYVRNNDYLGFYAAELELRKRRRYPPFVKLALIRASYPFDYEQGEQDLAALAQRCRQAGKDNKVMVLGPAPAPLRMLRGRKRFNCLLKGADWPSIRALFGAVAKHYAYGDSMRVSLDLDPVDML